MNPRLQPIAPLLLTALLAACGGGPPEATSQAPAAERAAAATAPPPVVQVSGLPDFTALVDAYGPAVVNITSIARRGASNAPGLSPDDPLYDFFRGFGFGTPDRRPPLARGEGSGFLVSPDGYLLTNAHVVDGATQVTVRTTDRREYRARVVGLDARTDVAVLKIDGEGLPTVQLGDPQGLKPGEWVIAIGSPFGFENSVSAGVVSGTARTLPGDAYTPFIQTDVAINPGNSGGPLFNLQGEVIGINSQIYSRTGAYQGISFAIPIDVALNVKDQLVAHGRVERGFIGVTIQDVNQTLADSFGLARPHGALVSEVNDGGPADRAGLETGDVILAVNGEPVETSGDLPPLIAAIKPGTAAQLKVWRKRAEREIRITIGALEDEPQVASRAPDAGEEEGRLGLAVRPLTGRERLALRTTGRIVVEDAAGPAEIAGLQPGDVVLAVNDSPVATVADFRDAVGRAGESVALLIERRGTQSYVSIRVES